MSYLSIALQRLTEQRQLIHADIASASGLSKSFISRFMSGESKELADRNFIAILSIFAADPRAQAELVAARCMDVRVGPGADLVDITVRGPVPGPRPAPVPVEVPLPQETERAFDWLRRQCPRNPDLEKHIVGYAKLTGMK